MASGIAYSVIVTNNSSFQQTVCLYQKDPSIIDGDVWPLAWMTKVLDPRTQASFTWTIDYSFVWSQSGVLVPGVVVEPAEVLPADLTSENAVTLTHAQGSFTFKNQTSGAQHGSLYINSDNTIPPNAASVGIGMSGAGTFVVPATANMSLAFTPHPSYWIAAGAFTPGQVILDEDITNSAEIIFESGVFRMYAVLNANDTWTISSTPAS